MLSHHAESLCDVQFKANTLKKVQLENHQFVQCHVQFSARIKPLRAKECVVCAGNDFVSMHWRIHVGKKFGIYAHATASGQAIARFKFSARMHNATKILANHLNKTMGIQVARVL